MASIVLPNSINYDEQLPSLLATTRNYTQVIAPSNSKSSYKEFDQIIVDLPNIGFLDPKSLYMRYQVVSTKAAGATNNSIIGCPVFTFISRIDTFINSQIIDSVSDWNTVAHQFSNLKLGVNEKYGNQFAFGYSDGTSATVTMDELDGRLSAATETFSVSGPIPSILLSGCEKMIPCFATGSIRLVFTLESNKNVYCYDSALGTTGFEIKNFEIVYDMIDFGPQLEQEILSRDSIVIKSNSYSASSVSVPVGASGQNTFVFNQKFASIRNAILSAIAGSPDANYLNGKFDACDLSQDGTYQLNVGGQVFPQGAPLNMNLNKAGILSELRKAVGNLYDWSISPSINSVEFGRKPNVTTSLTQPSKTYIGFDLNRVNSSSNMMLNGISSQNSPINAIVNIATALSTTSLNLQLVLNYDAIITILQ